jgi:exodeoxyribonuclease VII large subunit
MTNQDASSVSELTDQIKNVLENQFVSVRVEGEIGHINAHRSGHVYCSLKDENARIDAVIWRSTVARLSYKPDAGEQVIVMGRLSVYAPHGAYKLVINSLEPAGLGRLRALFEATRQELERAGLFDASHKKDLPLLPNAVGVVTSATGAARRDIESVLSRRSPQIPVFLYPANVQGTTAVSDLINGIKTLDADPDVDVIIVGRGGGSLEDLWSFNDAALARVIFACKTPVISAVGHETDTTISDMVADLRAPTPSAAAELAVPIRDDLLFTLTDMSERFHRLIRTRLNSGAQVLSREVQMLKRGVNLNNRQLLLDRLTRQLDRLVHQSLTARMTHSKQIAIRLARQNPQNQLAEQGKSLSALAFKLERLMEERMHGARYCFQRSVERLDALSPLSVLARGYSLTTIEGHVVMSADDVQTGDSIEVRVSNGTIKAAVTSSSINEERKG